MTSVSWELTDRCDEVPLDAEREGRAAAPPWGRAGQCSAETDAPPEGRSPSGWA